MADQQLPPTTSELLLAEVNTTLSIQDPVWTSAPCPELNTTNARLYSLFTPYINGIHYQDMYKKPNNKGNAVYCNLWKGNNCSMRVQLCGNNEVPLKVPFGLSVSEKSTDKNRMNMDITIQKDSALYQFFRSLDRKNLKTAILRSVEFFGRRISPVGVSELYKPILIPPSEKDKDGKPKDPKKIEKLPPTIRTKVVLEGERATRVLIKTGEKNGRWICEPGTWRDITPGCGVYPIVEVTGFWFMDKQVGMGMQCTDVIVIPKAAKPHDDYDGMDIIIQTGTNNHQHQQQQQHQQQETDQDMDEDLGQYSVAAADQDSNSVV